MRIIGRVVLILAGAFTVAAQATHEKILVPVFFSGPGAHGSQWWTNVSIANLGEKPLRFTRAVLEGDPTCAAVCGCGPSDHVDPGTVNQLCILNADPSGLLLYMEKSDSVYFGARVADLSQSGDTVGAELKIVRERELRQGQIIFPNVPIGPGYRVGLRLFDTLPLPSPFVVLRIHIFPEINTPLIEEIIPLNLPPNAGQPRPAHPAFAMIADIGARYPQLEAHGHGMISIELALPELGTSPPLPPAYWAVVTITNNATQQVTMMTPQ